MNTITLQDMPDDVLELIYSNLDIKDSVSTNVALHRRIIKSKIVRVFDEIDFNKIHKNYHKYIDIQFEINLKDIDKYKNVYGITIKTGSYLKLKDFNNLKTLTCSTLNNIDYSLLTNLTELYCPYTDLTNINTLTNLKNNK